MNEYCINIDAFGEERVIYFSADESLEELNSDGDLLASYVETALMSYVK